jgi:endonuclease III
MNRISTTTKPTANVLNATAFSHCTRTHNPDRPLLIDMAEAGMTGSNRAAILSKVHKVLKKHYKPTVPPAERNVLEHLLYACCLENARTEAADEAFAKLKELFFDWNEVRVTTTTELAEVMTSIPDASAAATRIKKSLQSVFEASYTFDLDPLQKQNLGKAEKDLEKIVGSSAFVRAYVVQHALGGHSIPVNAGAVDAMYAVGVISDNEAEKGLVPGAERAIPKNKGVEFGSLLQQFGADLAASPGSSKLRAILGEIDSQYKERLEKRIAIREAFAKLPVVREKKPFELPVPTPKPNPAAEAKAIKEKETAARIEKAKAADKAAADKIEKEKNKDKAAKAAAKSEQSKPAKDSGKDKPKDKPKSDPKSAGKKPDAKGLAKKKPR